MLFITDFLAAHNYIELHLGVYCRQNPEFSRMSRMKATRKLTRMFKDHNKIGVGTIKRRIFPVILRDENKNDIFFPIDNRNVKDIIKNINRINRLLLKHDIFIPCESFKGDQEGINDYLCHFQPYTQKYCRIFNNSSLNWDFGGRYYNHWSQQIKFRYRKLIQIDGRRTIEADYKCLHISMLYALEKKPVPEGDLYDLPDIDRIYRPVIKKAVNIFINAPSESIAFRALAKHTRQFYREHPYCTYLPGIKILAALKKKHEPVSHYFTQGVGIKLQAIDSRIATKIMLYFLRKDIPVLCIHDSFIIDEMYKDELKSIMEAAYYNEIGSYPGVDFKEQAPNEISISNEQTNYIEDECNDNTHCEVIYFDDFSDDDFEEDNIFFDDVEYYPMEGIRTYEELKELIC